MNIDEYNSRYSEKYYETGSINELVANLSLDDNSIRMYILEEVEFFTEVCYERPF